MSVCQCEPLGYSYSSCTVAHRCILPADLALLILKAIALYVLSVSQTPSLTRAKGFSCRRSIPRCRRVAAVGTRGSTALWRRVWLKRWFLARRRWNPTLRCGLFPKGSAVGLSVFQEQWAFQSAVCFPACITLFHSSTSPGVCSLPAPTVQHL